MLLFDFTALWNCKHCSNGILRQGPSLLENFGGQTSWDMHVSLCISHKYNTVGYVSMTSPCSLNRST